MLPQFASGLASYLAGFIITQNSSEQIAGYETVGYIAVAANVLAILIARIVMQDQREKAR